MPGPRTWKAHWLRGSRRCGSIAPAGSVPTRRSQSSPLWLQPQPRWRFYDEQVSVMDQWSNGPVDQCRETNEAELRADRTQRLRPVGRDPRDVDSAADGSQCQPTQLAARGRAALE